MRYRAGPPHNDRRRRSNRRASVNVTTPPGVAPGEAVWGRVRALPGGASTRDSCRSGSTSPAQRAAEVGRAPQAMALAAGLSEGAHGNEGMSPNPLISAGRPSGAATGGRLVNVTTPPRVALGGAAWDRARTLQGGASAKDRAHPEALHSQHGGRLEVGQAPQAAGRIRAQSFYSRWRARRRASLKPSQPFVSCLSLHLFAGPPSRAHAWGGGRRGVHTYDENTPAGSGRRVAQPPASCMYP